MKRPTALLAVTIGLGAFALGQGTAFAAAPTILKTTISQVTTTSATLEAEVNPKGKPTGWHFAYGPVDCSATPGSCANIPIPDGVIAKGEAPVKVKAEIKGLTPGATYHFLLAAENADGKAKSPDRTLMPYPLPQEFPACPNDFLRRDNPAAARIEYPSANLPDCRGFEQVSPVDKGAGDVLDTVPVARASLTGGGAIFLSLSGVPGGVGSQDFPLYLASRGEGWSSHGLLPPAGFGQQAGVIGWTPDFSDIYTKATQLGPSPLGQNLMNSAGAGGLPREIVEQIPELKPNFAGASEGGAEVLFESKAAIPGLAGAIAGKPNLYLWQKESDTLSLAGVLNDELAPPNGAIGGPYDWNRGTTAERLATGGATQRYYTQDQHAISADGSAVYFTAAGSGRLYVRLNPTQPQSDLDGEDNCTKATLACTVQLNASKRTIPDPAGAAPAAFMGASADGKTSLFTSTQMLTDDANTGPEQEAAAVVRADIGGGNVQPAFVPTHASGVAVDSGHVYWADLDSGAIGRAKLDGSGIEAQFITATDNPKGLAVEGEYIYWTNAGEEEGEGTIGRARLNGEAAASEVDQDFVEGAGNPWAVAANGEHVYWTNSALNNQAKSFIGRANIDGTEAGDEFLEVFGEGKRLPGIALDGANVYWMGTNPLDQSVIGRADLDGGNYVITFVFVATNSEDEREKHGRGIAVEGNHIYWAAQGTSEIGRAKLNGEEGASEIELGFIKGAGHPLGLAADASHIYWSANGEASPNPGNDLYQYDAVTGTLSDLAPDSTDPNGAEVRGVLGTSADASYVYFAANGMPDGVANTPNGRGEVATPGKCPAVVVNSGVGECNLYLAHAGAIEFIARLEVGGAFSDVANWAASPLVFAGYSQKTARVTPDGQTLLFRSQRRLSDYENEGTPELYRYQAGDSAVSCVSCNPTGMAPSGVVNFFGAITTPAVIPAFPASTLSHNLSADGNRVFFETTDALVGADTNGDGGCPRIGTNLQQFPACGDVYEWEAEGTGSCDAAHAIAEGGCLYLISTGKGTEPQMIADASGDGGEVLFFSRSKLVGQDEDSLQDLYSARVGGGLAAQNPPPPNPCQGAAACHPPGPHPPEVPAPPKFSGPGNPKNKSPPCAKGKHRVKGRCVSKKAKKAHKKSAKGKANAQGRTGR